MCAYVCVRARARLSVCACTRTGKEGEEWKRESELINNSAPQMQPHWILLTAEQKNQKQWHEKNEYLKMHTFNDPTT